MSNAPRVHNVLTPAQLEVKNKLALLGQRISIEAVEQSAAIIAQAKAQRADEVVIDLMYDALAKAHDQAAMFLRKKQHEEQHPIVTA